MLRRILNLNSLPCHQQSASQGGSAQVKDKIFGMCCLLRAVEQWSSGGMIISKDKPKAGQRKT
jgi:hypothetical protein